MSNEHASFPQFDRESFDALLLSSDRQKNIDVYMDGVLKHFKHKIETSLKPFQPVMEATIPIDLSELAPAPRNREVPIWENKPKETPSRPQTESKPPVLHDYPEVPKTRPIHDKTIIFHASQPPIEKGAMITDHAKAPSTDTFSEAPQSSSLEPVAPPTDKTPKGKKVNTDAIEKRYKDREEKLGDLFKNRGQIS